MPGVDLFDVRVFGVLSMWVCLILLRMVESVKNQEIIS